MKIISKTLALAALSATLVAAKSGIQRELQDIETVCAACQACETLGDLCSISDIFDLACTNCALIPVEGFCDTCTVCDTGGACDPDAIKDLACGLCDLDGGDDNDNDDGDDGGDACFSEVATVRVWGNDNDMPTAMKDLKRGDRVMTTDGTYQEVYSFGHYNPTRTATFFQIYSKNTARPLEVTAEHLVFLQGKSSPVPSQTIKVGDVLRGAHEDGSRVTRIKTVERKGIYAPLTTGGTLLVDGVAASSYIHLGEGAKGNDHDITHRALSVYRLLCNGVSEAFCDARFYNQDGMPFIVAFGLGLLQWLLNSNAAVQTVGMSVFTIVTGACQLLEGVFGSSLAPLMVFLAAVGYAVRRRSQKSKAKAI